MLQEQLNKVYCNIHRSDRVYLLYKEHVTVYPNMAGNTEVNTPPLAGSIMLLVYRKTQRAEGGRENSDFNLLK